jgi:hypothetical protein
MTTDKGADGHLPHTTAIGNNQAMHGCTYLPTWRTPFQNSRAFFWPQAVSANQRSETSLTRAGKRSHERVPARKKKDTKRRERKSAFKKKTGLLA